MVVFGFYWFEEVEFVVGFVNLVEYENLIGFWDYFGILFFVFFYVF